MKELLRSNDPVLLSWVEALLTDARIGCVVLDAYTSAIEGSILAIPRRLMVGDDDYATARRLLAAADYKLLSDEP
jgi:Putative prokaryotic signal transducing protein